MSNQITEIMDLCSQDDLRRFFPPAVYRNNRRVTAEEVAHLYGLAGGFWQHSGKAHHRHIELASGRHSNGFINGRVLLSYGRICRMLAGRIANCIVFPADLAIDVVLTASYGGNDLGAQLADILGARHVYTEKRDKEQVFSGQTIYADELVLPLEELITTGGTGRKMIEAVGGVIKDGVAYADLFPAIIRRKPETLEIGGIPIAPLVEFDMWDADPAACPLCAAGSVAIKPKEGNNWDRLIGEMQGVINP